jgi:predicted  nucleic acid-binding Zn-ribbon protein
VHADVEALLALQQDDGVIHEMEKALAALIPKRQELDRAKQSVTERVARAKAALEAEEKKQRELHGRISEHRAIHEKNVAQLDQVKRLREATAAMSQVERARRVLADEEGELAAMVRRLGEQRTAIISTEAELGQIEIDQQAARAALTAEAERIGGELEVARAKRTQLEMHVPKSLVAPYNRIRAKRPARAVIALRGSSCGACDTAVPLQRRSVMTATGQVEVCEACGVLMYATT